MGCREGWSEVPQAGSWLSSENWIAVNASRGGFEDTSHQLRWPHLKCRRGRPEGWGGSVFQQRRPLAPSQRAPQAEGNIEPVGFEQKHLIRPLLPKKDLKGPGEISLRGLEKLSVICPRGNPSSLWPDPHHAAPLPLCPRPAAPLPRCPPRLPPAAPLPLHHHHPTSLPRSPLPAAPLPLTFPPPPPRRCSSLCPAPWLPRCPSTTTPSRPQTSLWKQMSPGSPEAGGATEGQGCPLRPDF